MQRTENEALTWTFGTHRLHKNDRVVRLRGTTDRPIPGAHYQRCSPTDLSRYSYHCNGYRQQVCDNMPENASFHKDCLQ